MTNQEAIENLQYLINDDCTDTQSDYVEEIELAIEALEKQYPKVPITIIRSKDMIGYKCPECGQDSIPINKPCCWWCGQALNWELAYEGESKMSDNLKYDDNKPRLDLVPPELIEAVGIIRTYGVSKYGDSESWKQVEPYRYRAALMRHICLYIKEPDGVDAESGLPHLWHIACNVAFLIALNAEKCPTSDFKAKTVKIYQTSNKNRSQVNYDEIRRYLNESTSSYKQRS